ncbi:GNAT family N-acetyltransferase [Paenibacillus sp. NPDC058071]|uniref:GNAT family N-acetyltransferase n=1 Tax=Paenibacillus sp. NPDC058071 TaxID=3346326 RepID=UPI0036DF8386
MIKADGLSKITNYEKVTNEYSPSFSGIVAGECKGDLWVDQVQNPKIAVANSYAVGGFAFFGAIESEEESNSVKGFIHKQLFAWLKSKEIGYFEFSIESDGLRNQVLNMFDDQEIQSEKEFSFRKKDETPESLHLPEEYILHEVDHKFWASLNEGAFDNRSFVTERIRGSWQSFDDFHQRSLAFCITHSTKIVAVIAGTASFNDVIAIDIETEEAHRNKGLALLLTGKFVNECVSRGLTAQWDCVESNPASRKLAEKAGFTFIKQNEVYWVKNL